MTDLDRRRSAVRPLLPLLVVLTALLSTSVIRAAAPIAMEPHEEPLFGLATVVPADWESLGQGLYARRESAVDATLLAVQSARVAREALWPSLLPQLQLETVPEPSGSMSTAALTWDLYALEVAAPGATVAVDLAVAEEDGTTYLVLLQAPPDERQALHEAVFLPVVEALVPLAPEPTIDPATMPYDSTEVTFPGGAPDVTLAGTLTTPRTAGPHPAVILLSGSGAQDRDESLRPVTAFRPFAILADALTRAGVAVLRYDDRGVGASTGAFDAAGLADLTADAAAALAYLRSRDDIDPGRIGLLGHSEGGIHAASLVSSDPDLAFVVGMAAPAANGVDLMVAQNGALVRSTGGTEEEAVLAEVFTRDLFEAVLDGDTVAAAEAVREYFGATWDRQPDATRDVLGPRDEYVERQVTAQLGAVQDPWFVDLLRSDAGDGWARATVPVLGIFGGLDVQVPASQNAPLMETQLAGGDPASRVVVLPDANHLFQAAITGAVSEYGSLEPAFTPGFLPLVVDWVVDRTGATAAP